MSTTQGMKGGGYYDEHSEYQQEVAATGSELVRSAVARTTRPSPGAAYVVADYGCATGRGSAASVRTAVDAVRDGDPERPIVTVHNDMSTNDWNTLFGALASDPDGPWHAAGPPVISFASAISFFEAATPPAFVHLGMSFSAAHWLRAQPTVEVDGFYFCEATGAAREALANQAEDDWTRFLEMRASDLATGARLVVQMVGTARPTEGEPLVTARELLRAMAAVARTMADDGLLDVKSVQRYLLPVYARTIDEARRPLEKPGAVASAFTIETVDVAPVANPYLDQYHADGDAGRYAHSYAAFVRGFTESSLREHLFGPGARGAEADARLDEFFDRLEQRFRADPETDAFRDWTLSVVVARR